MHPSRRLLGTLVVVVVVALAASERGGRWLYARYRLPTRGAAWIWAADVSARSQPAAFFAVRDFEVSDPVPEQARILIQADAAYHLHLNGKWIGAGRYAQGAPADEYHVGALLRPGPNRLLLELSSGTGAGGALLSLFAGAGEDPLVGTDGLWRTFSARRGGLLEGWRPLDGGSPAWVWQTPPTGRWGAPRSTTALPPLSERLGPAVPGERILPLHGACAPPCEEAEQVRHLLHEEAAGATEPGSRDTAFLVDFGVARVGFLELDVRAAPRRLHAVHTSATLGDLATGDRHDLILMSRATVWRSPFARPMRYALVVGVEDLVRARLFPVADEWMARELARGTSEPTLFGFDLTD